MRRSTHPPFPVDQLELAVVLQAENPAFPDMPLSDGQSFEVWGRGVPCMDLEREISDRKSIMALRSFGRPVTALPELREAVAAYTARAAEKLRRQHLATASLVVFIETSRFKTDDAQHYAARPVRLPVATSDSGKLIGAALTGLTSIWRDGYRYKKAGVVLLDLHPAAAVQVGLFDKADNARRGARRRGRRDLSVAAHCLYEQNPDRVAEPEGVLLVPSARYEEIDERRTREPYFRFPGSAIG